MSSKQKQVVSRSVFVSDEAYDDDKQPVFDAAYFKSLAHKEAPPVSQEESERRQKIEGLYPTFRQKEIPLEDLVPAPSEWNYFKKSPALVEELMKNIAVYGQQSPAIVWEQEDGRYMILGGHTRYQALCSLRDLFLQNHDEAEAARYETMYCNIYAHDTLDDIEARKIIIYDNTIRRENTTAVKVQSIINMNRLMKDTRPAHRPDTKRVRIAKQISEIFGDSEGTIKGLYQLRNLIPEFWPLLDSKDSAEKITQQFARATSVLPSHLQRFLYESGLYQQKWTSRKLRMLTHAQSEEEIEGLFTEPDPYVIRSQLTTDVPIPDTYKALTIPCSVTEIAAVKHLIHDALTSSDQVSEQTKELIRKLF